ncbi:MAG: hypothetical protein ACJ8G3_00330 [Burkholderiaceae bacterium]
MDTNYSARLTKPSHADAQKAAQQTRHGNGHALWTEAFDVDAANASIAHGASAVEMTSADKVFQHASVILLSEDHQCSHAPRYLFRNLDALHSLRKDDVVMMFEALPQGCNTEEIFQNPTTPAYLKSLIRDGFRIIGLETAVSARARFRWGAWKQQIRHAQNPIHQRQAVAALQRELNQDADQFRAPNAKTELAAAAAVMLHPQADTLLDKASLGLIWSHLDRAILHESQIELNERMASNKSFAEQISAASDLYPHVLVQLGRNHSPDMVPDAPGVESLLNQKASRAGRLPAVSLYMSDDSQTFERRPHSTRCREKVGIHVREVQRTSARDCLWLPGAAFAEDEEFATFFNPRNESAARTAQANPAQANPNAPAACCVIL